MCRARVAAAICCFAATVVVQAGDEEPSGRPRMEQMRPAAALGQPPSQRDLVDARAVLERRFREPLAHTATSAGANAAAAALLDAAATEQDRAVKWLMLAEARRLAAAAGNATMVDRSIVLADAAYDFDAVAEEHRALREIPLRALDRARAAALAGVAEGLAERAETDGRGDVAVDAWMLAIRGWQRAGDNAAARRAATRLAEAERGRPTALP